MRALNLASMVTFSSSSSKMCRSRRAILPKVIVSRTLYWIVIEAKMKDKEENDFMMVS